MDDDYTLHSGMSEIEFIDAIDASFYFNSTEEYFDAVEIACQISDNAVLMIGYELASGGSHASMDVNVTILKMMEELRPSNVILASIPVIKACLLNKSIPPKYLINLYNECARHSNAWNGLGIIECADESMHGECDKIRNHWSSEAID